MEVTEQYLTKLLVAAHATQDLIVQWQGRLVTLNRTVASHADDGDYVLAGVVSTQSSELGRCLKELTALYKGVI